MTKKQISWYPTPEIAELVKDTEDKDFISACVLAVFYLGLESEVGLLFAAYRQSGGSTLEALKEGTPDWFQKSWIDNVAKIIENHPVMEAYLLRFKSLQLAQKFDGVPLKADGTPVPLTREEEAEIALG